MGLLFVIAVVIILFGILKIRERITTKDAPDIPSKCTKCGAEIIPDERNAYPSVPKMYLCPRCRAAQIASDKGLHRAMMGVLAFVSIPMLIGAISDIVGMLAHHKPLHCKDLLEYGTVLCLPLLWFSSIRDMRKYIPRDDSERIKISDQQ